jgi:type II secretory pathway component PulF
MKRFKIMYLNRDNKQQAVFVEAKTKTEAREAFIRRYPSLKLRIIGVHAA